MTERDAAIRAQIGRVRESLDELEQLLAAKPAKRLRGPRKLVKVEPRVMPRPEAVGSMRRTLRGMGVRT